MTPNDVVRLKMVYRYMISLLKAMNMTNIISFIDENMKGNIDAVFRRILLQLMQ